ncbi:MAG: GspE/PulE family protein [Pseudomonadota bacterium]
MSTPAQTDLVQSLVRAGLLTRHEQHAVDNLVQALGEGALGAVRRLDTVDAQVLFETLDRINPYPQVNIDTVAPDARALALFSPEWLSAWQVIPFALSDGGDEVSVACGQPGDLATRDAVQAQVPDLTVLWFRCEPLDLARALTRLRASAERLQAVIESGDDNAVAIVDQLLQRAVIHRASDIHVQPEAGFARLRLRVDGVLETAALVSSSQCQALCVRLKVLAGLDVADSRAVQDGHVTRVFWSEEHRFRLSVLPTDQGEAIVLRVLSTDSRALPLDALGIDAESMALLHGALARHDGLLLMAGPTGSGKTTTLHALLETYRGPQQNILTLEDPAEYTAPWLRQSSIDPQHGIDYADGVRAALRQDPDVILIGEIRDPESARMAWRASMTGHRVLSTVHASSAVAVVPRLVDLGVSRALIANQLAAVVSQRLLRRLCVHCAPSTPPPLDDAVGCDACQGRGYRGRLAVVEVLRFDDAVCEATEMNRPLRGALDAVGFVPLARRAWQAVCAGRTTVAEYRRVIGVPPTGRACD